MGAVREKQVGEILDYDNNINQQLVRVEKKQFARWDDGAPEIMAYMQTQGDVVDAAKRVASDLIVLLERKISLMFIFDRTVDQDSTITPEVQKQLWGCRCRRGGASST